jgi:hypothetical protein
MGEIIKLYDGAGSFYYGSAGASSSPSALAADFQFQFHTRELG